MVQWSSANKSLNVYVNVTTGKIAGIEEQKYLVPSPPIEAIFDKIEGLTAIRVSGGIWDNWDADIEDDGPIVGIVYLDARGNIITDESTKKMPISADVKVYASDSPLAPKTRLVFSAHYTEDQIILGSIYPKIRIPKEEMSVNPSVDYKYGAVAVTIHTPQQGSFSDKDDFIVLYEE
jgi:hypothetical protein